MVSTKEKTLIQFELAGPQEVSKLHDVATLAYFQSYFGPYTYDELSPYLEDFFSEPVLARKINEPNLDYFLVKLSGRPIGFSLIEKGSGYEKGQVKVQENVANLSKLYLLQKYTGKGIGTRFMKVMCDYCCKLNIRLLFSSAWSLNPKALRFYKRQGFRVIGEIEYGFASKSNIDLVLSKELIPSSDQMP